MSDQPGKTDPAIMRSFDDVTLARTLKEVKGRYTMLLEQSRTRYGEKTNVETEALRELARAIEELNVSYEELRAQNDALRDAYHEVETERQHYTDLFSLIPDAYVVTDVFGTILDANNAAEELLGTKGGRVRGKPLAIFVTEDERREFRTRLNEVSVTAKASEWEAMIVPRGGMPIRAVMRVAVMSDSHRNRRMAWLIRDVSEKQRAVTLGQRFAEEQTARIDAERSARRFRMLAEISRQIALETNVEAICNNICKTVVRYAGDHCEIVLLEGSALHSVARCHREPRQAAFTDALRRRHNLVIDNNDSLVWRAVRTNEPQVAPTLAEELSDGYSRSELFDALRRNGPRNAAVLPLTLAGQVFGALIIVSATPAPQFSADDIGIFLEVATRTSLAVGNARLFTDLERANKEKADFLAVLSHELRTPLTAVMGYAELLLAGVPDTLPPAARDHVERIRACSWHELSVIEQIIHYARIDRGDDRPTLVEIDLAAVVHEVSEVVNPETKRVELAIDLPGTPIRFKTDSGRLRQILVNLLNNAFKFTEEGGVTFSVRRSDDDLFFTISDTGVGIAPDELPHVFDPFWRSNAARMKERAGMGLGLAVSENLAHSLGGELSVQSQLNVGTAFVLRLPIS